MDFEVAYTLENEQQFWDELDEIVASPGDTHETIDNALRNYLSFTTSHKDEYLSSEEEVARCSYKLLEAELFKGHADYVRRQIIYCLLQEDATDTLHLIAAFLLYDGRSHETTFESLNDEGGFPRLLELIREPPGEDAALHRTLMHLLYEMSRIQRIRNQDLLLIDDDFIMHLLRIIESLSDDASDPYHYPVIRVLLVLNEQYMVSAHEPNPGNSPVPPLPNRVIRVLSAHGTQFKTFGENIILLLNRESETSLQLLILKLLYLLFTTPRTYEYFYTNDLRVLVDVMIRNLLDLPFTADALRHTYLRVLYPLLQHTQLSQPEHHYKSGEIRKLLTLMAGGCGASLAHFGAMDETTRRLGARCARVAWLQMAPLDSATSPVDGADSNGAHSVDGPRSSSKHLGIGLHPQAAESTLSVNEIAAHKAPPGAQTPSRARERLAQARLSLATGDADLAPAATTLDSPRDALYPNALQSPFGVEG